MKRLSLGSRQVIILLLCLLFVPLIHVSASGGFGDLNDTLGATNYNSAPSIKTVQSISLSVESQLTEKIKLVQESIKKLADKPDYELLGVIAQFTASGIALLLGLDVIKKYERRRTRPIFNISIYPTSSDGVRVSYGHDGNSKKFTYCYSLRVENMGRRKMENVEVVINEKYDKIGLGEYNLDQKFDSINLGWSNTIMPLNPNYKLTTMPAIQPKQQKSCDFGRTDKVADRTDLAVDYPIRSNVIFGFVTNFIPYTGTTLLLPGEYKLKIIFTADDIEFEPRWYDLKIIDTEATKGDLILNNNISFKEGSELQFDPISLTYKEVC